MMDFPIADTFANGITRLTGDERKAIKTTALDLQSDAANSGPPHLHPHAIDKPKGAILMIRRSLR